MAECEENLDNEPKCESCLTDDNKGSKAATFFCSECMDFLCSACKADHSENKILKSHTILSKAGKLFNTLRDMKEILYCKDHGNLRIYVCEDHSELICEVCIKRNHRNCKNLTKSTISPEDTMQVVSTLDEKIQASYDKMSCLLVRQNYAAGKQDVYLDGLQEFIDKYRKRNDNGDEIETSAVEKEEVSSFISSRQDMVNVVSKLNDSTKEQIVANYVHLSTKERYSSLCDLKDVEQKTMDAEEFTKKLAIIHRISIDTFQDAVIGAETGGVNVQCDKQTVETQTDPILDTEHDDAQSNVDNICSSDTNLNTKKEDVETRGANGRGVSSNLVIKETVGDGQYSTGPDSVPGMVKRVVNDASTMTCNVQLVDTESQTNKMDYYRPSMSFLQRKVNLAGYHDICQEGEASCRISDVLIVNNDNIVIADSWNDNLKLYNRDFHLKCVVATKGEHISMCKITDDRIAVSLDTKSVDIYSVTNSLHFLKQFKLKYHCRGICTTSANTIALLLSDEPMRENFGSIRGINSKDDKIQIEFRSHANGQILHVIDEFDEELERPSFILEDTRGNIVVGEKDQLTAFNKKGDRKWFYKSCEDIKLEGTQGMDIDGEGNIYVCGYDSNNIHQVSCLNYRCNRAIIPYVPKPTSVSFDYYNDRLIVGSQGAGGIFVYDFI